MKMLGYNVLKQAITESEDRLQNSLSQFTEINIIIVLIAKVRGLKFKQQPHNQPHKSHNFRLFYKEIFRWIDLSFRLTGCIHLIILRLWGLLCVRDGRRRGIAKSLQLTDASPHFNASS